MTIQTVTTIKSKLDALMCEIKAANDEKTKDRLGYAYDDLLANWYATDGAKCLGHLYTYYHGFNFFK